MVDSFYDQQTNFLLLILVHPNEVLYVYDSKLFKK
jgi:hypothetical protein